MMYVHTTYGWCIYVCTIYMQCTGLFAAGQIHVTCTDPQIRCWIDTHDYTWHVYLSSSHVCLSSSKQPNLFDKWVFICMYVCANYDRRVHLCGRMYIIQVQIDDRYIHDMFVWRVSFHMIRTCIYMTWLFDVSLFIWYEHVYTWHAVSCSVSWLCHGTNTDMFVWRSFVYMIFMHKMHAWCIYEYIPHISRGYICVLCTCIHHITTYTYMYEIYRCMYDIYAYTYTWIYILNDVHMYVRYICMYIVCNEIYT